MIVGFFVPAIVEEYAMQAADFEATSLSIDTFTATGVKARIRGDFSMDARRAKRNIVQDLGRLGTYIVREVETRETNVSVSLPEYGNLILGTAAIPPIKVNVRNGWSTQVDFLTYLEPGSKEGIRRLANDWLDGRLGQLRVQARAEVGLRSGLFSLGTHTLTQSVLFEGDDLPSTPAYNITNVNFHEIELADATKGMAADASLVVQNDYAVDLEVPPLGFAILTDNCFPDDLYITFADATTDVLHIRPKENLHVNVIAIIRRLPDALVTVCPGSRKSPFDSLVGDYIHGNETTVLVRGSDSPSLSTPQWITDLISGITVPVPFPGHTFGHLIRNFTLADVRFNLPVPFAEPETPESRPRISAHIRALVAVPAELDFPIGVDRVRADADVFYHGAKLGHLDLRKWQKANATSIRPHDKEEGGLLVESAIENAPLQVTDDKVFAEVIRALVFGDEMVQMTVKSDVDVEMETALGKFVVREIPAEGAVPVKPIGIGRFGSGYSLVPQVSNLRILSTGVKNLTLQATLNITNPTNYSAAVPYFDVNILNNGTVLGHATAKDVVVAPGVNPNITIEATWDPSTASGDRGMAVARELLSMYISGFNTTLTLKTHNASIPSQPTLGKALEALEINMPTPRLTKPTTPGDGNDDDDEDDGKPHFIEDTTMHLFTSTATFTLLSPLAHSTLYITHLNATAFYRGDPVGRILTDELLEVPPGRTATPRLPVDWSLGSVGYDAVKNALGGTLRLGASAEVGIRVGTWEERVWFRGQGIGARVRL